MDYGTITLSVLASGAMASVIALIAKKVIDRSVDHLFHEQEAKFDAQITAKLQANDVWFKEELKAYPVIVEQVYRCRNAARECLQQEPLSKKTIDYFLELSDNLTDQLFKNRIFISPDIFPDLHEYRKKVWEFATLLRSKGKISPDSKIGEEISQHYQYQLEKNWGDIDNLYSLIIKNITELMEKRKKL